MLRRVIRNLEKKVLRPFDFFANFTYYLGQRNPSGLRRYGILDAWQIAGKTISKLN